MRVSLIVKDQIYFNDGSLIEADRATDVCEDKNYLDLDSAFADFDIRETTFSSYDIRTKHNFRGIILVLRNVNGQSDNLKIKIPWISEREEWCGLELKVTRYYCYCTSRVKSIITL